MSLRRDGTINSTYNHVTTLLHLDENREEKEFNLVFIAKIKCMIREMAQVRDNKSKPVLL